MLAPSRSGGLPPACSESLSHRGVWNLLVSLKLLPVCQTLFLNAEVD